MGEQVCELCKVPLGVPIKDGLGFLPYFREWPSGTRTRRDGPYCKPCLDRLLAPAPERNGKRDD